MRDTRREIERIAKTPTLAAFGSCDPTGSSPPNDVVAAVSDPNLVYSAQINATTGSGTGSDTGGSARSDHSGRLGTGAGTAGTSAAR